MTPSKANGSSRQTGPLLPRPKGEAIQCQFCEGQGFRRSRLRTDDIIHLLRLRYPARCVRCGQRQYISFTVAALSLSSTTRQPRPKREVSQEKSWTEPADRMVLRSTSKQEPPQS